MNNRKFAYIVWNPFQIVQFENIYNYFKTESCFIIIDRGSNISLFDFKKIKAMGFQYHVIKQRDLSSIDGVYDILFFQSAFPNIERIKLSKLVSVQYGLAKERHNYGEWRALADLNLMYGPYSVSHVKHFSPSYAVGNPKFEFWNNRIENPMYKVNLQQAFNIDQSKKTILYMPTWGELGSCDTLLQSFASIRNDYNIIFKMHHNNDLRYPKWAKQAKKLGIQWIFEGAVDQLDLLCLADLVVSDYSGAIFDAMLANKPILLFQDNPSDKVGIQKFNLNSLEFRCHDEIGLVCKDLSEFIPQIEYALTHSDEILVKPQNLKKKLFINYNNTSGVCLSVANIITKFLNNETPPMTAEQLYVRETVQQLRLARIELKKFKKNKTFFQKLRGL